MLLVLVVCVGESGVAGRDGTGGESTRAGIGVGCTIGARVGGTGDLMEDLGGGGATFVAGRGGELGVCVGCGGAGVGGGERTTLDAADRVGDLAAANEVDASFWDLAFLAA